MLRFGCAAYSGLTVRHPPVFAVLFYREKADISTAFLWTIPPRESGHFQIAILRTFHSDIDTSPKSGRHAPDSLVAMDRITQTQLD
jgi:hypothetical protein